jgi:isoleucyl-tRNA synthetase
MMSRVTTERFPQLPSTTTALEEEIQQRWEEEDTFARSLEQTEGGEPFVFYEGPPTANGRPGLHHILARTIKDTVARFRTMQGRHVTRIAGWDTHGLPVEIEAERRLGISGKREIEELGIARFNEVCRESVMTYTEEWERFSARIGYWLDYSNPYVTYRPEYIETVWWLLKQIWDRDLIYRGHKILPYCPRCGTGLSSHEVAQGYREIRDPSLYFTVPVLDRDGAPDGREFLVWTTTPWTVVSNVALAVHPDLEYAEVRAGDRRYLLAKERVEAVFPDGDAETVRTVPGRELVGLRYRRPFDWVEAEGEEALNAWQVIPEEFVSAEDGTGIVHLSPAFGADDYEAGRRHGLPVLRPVDDRGRFLESLPIVGGQFVKDADDALVEDLKARGHLFRATREAHSYPHCWRCRSPLLYMARDSWFIRTTAVRDDLLASNAQVRWHPPEIGEGRFGEWLKNNVDWAISRNRYWGTPLPVWVCDGDAECTEAIGSFEELRERAGDLPEEVDPHRPFIDEVTWPCRQEGCVGTMRRTPEVIDVWFDSGSMPYAQWHYPFENREAFERHFPADFICEGVDQTRGWFYSLIAISTLLGRGPAYRNVIVNDLILDAEGQKMSKSRGNVVDPWEALRDHGADAIRWYLLGSSNPWLPKRFDPDGVREGERKVFDTLRNSYRFFALYANLEGWTPEMEAPRRERAPGAGPLAPLPARPPRRAGRGAGGGVRPHARGARHRGFRHRRPLQLVRPPLPGPLLGERRRSRRPRGLRHPARGAGHHGAADSALRPLLRRLAAPRAHRGRERAPGRPSRDRHPAAGRCAGEGDGARARAGHPGPRGPGERRGARPPAAGPALRGGAGGSTGGRPAGDPAR